MFTLVTGGAASGKSEYAEQHVLHLSGPRIYIATMEPFGEEAMARIRKHREMRRDKGFETIECSTGLRAVQVPHDSNVLLEDLGNLVANEIFSPSGSGPQAVRDGINALLAKCANLTIVTNEIFSGGEDYSEDTIRYMRELAKINRELAERTDLTVEIVCGLQNTLKETEVKEKDGMIFVTGPLFAGKQAYIQKILDWTDEDFQDNGVRDVQDFAAAAESLEELEELADKLSQKMVVISTETGSGVIPIDPQERKRREYAGIMNRLLAQRAQTVIRVCCGIPQVLKSPQS